MKKRKQASPSKGRSARGGRSASSAGRGRSVAQVTKSTGSPGTEAGLPAAISAPASATVALSAECTVSEAASLKERLAPLLEESQPVTLDVNAVQRVDTAGLQVIMAFVRERAGRGRTVEWQGAAPALTGAAQLLGLTSLLGLPA